MPHAAAEGVGKLFGLNIIVRSARKAFSIIILMQQIVQIGGLAVSALFIHREGWLIEVLGE